MASSLRQFLFSLTLASVILGSGYFTVRALITGLCDTTRTYTIGSVDPRFGISTSTVLSHLQEASDVWNGAYATSTLLAYTPSRADITVNFVYDERQRTTIQNERLKQTINQEKEDLSEIKETIESLRAEYETLSASIQTRTASYSTRLAKHNNEVAYWNKRGGAPNEAYQRLQREAAGLETERVRLNADIGRFNTLAERIRQYGSDHNEIVSDINEKIGTLNETALREFEEGTYDPRTRTITIYEYSSETSLRRVLIHELGHSIGLDHVEDKEAIMYPVNQGKNTALTKADKEELVRTCQQSGSTNLLAIRDDIVHLVVSSWLGITAQSK